MAIPYRRRASRIAGKAAFSANAKRLSATLTRLCSSSRISSNRAMKSWSRAAASRRSWRAARRSSRALSGEASPASATARSSAAWASARFPCPRNRSARSRACSKSLVALACRAAQVGYTEPAPAPNKAMKKRTSPTIDRLTLFRRANLPNPYIADGGAGQHGFVAQVAPHIRREGTRRLIAPIPVLLKRFHHDPVQLAAEQPAELARIAPALF